MTRPEDAPNPPVRRLEIVAVAGVVLLGLVLRVATRSHLWLDEALSANIASLPLSDLVDALRHDGHPPLYYALLHLWMDVVGEGDLAVRALSGIASALTLPLVYVLARRRRGPAAGAAALALAAVIPYATRYATEARMYALVMFLVALGWWLIDLLLDGRGGRLAAASLAVVGSLLLYSHYWSVWILGVTGLGLLLVRWRSADPDRRRGGQRGAIALFVAGLSFLPWLPVMLDQLAHTGTPWGAPQRPTMSVSIALVDFAGGGVVTEAVLGSVVLTILVALGIAGVPQPPTRIALELRTVPGIRVELAVTMAALGVGLVVAWLSGATFASRYAAFALPVVVVASGIGVVVAPSRLTRALLGGGAVAVLAGAAVLGALEERTQGYAASEAVDSAARPGDVVLVCPDQLGPAFARELDADVEVLTHPSLEGPDLVDWREYEERNRLADPDAVAREVLDRAGEGTVWLVWMSGYATYESQCEELREVFATARPAQTVVTADAGEVFEPMWVERFPSSP